MKNKCIMFSSSSTEQVYQEYQNFLMYNDVEIISTTCSMSYKSQYTYDVILMVTYKQI